MKTLLRGGYVVSGRGCRRADVLIDGEKVEMLGHIPPELAAQSEVVDVTGCMLFPGFIDAAAKAPSAAARRRSSTLPAPIKGNPLPMGLISGIKRLTASATATTASI